MRVYGWTVSNKTTVSAYYKNLSFVRYSHTHSFLSSHSIKFMSEHVVFMVFANAKIRFYFLALLICYMFRLYVQRAGFWLLLFIFFTLYKCVYSRLWTPDTQFTYLYLFLLFLLFFIVFFLSLLLPLLLVSLAITYNIANSYMLYLPVTVIFFTLSKHGSSLSFGVVVCVCACNILSGLFTGTSSYSTKRNYHKTTE